MALSQFDPASGQVFTEQVMSASLYFADANGPVWTHESPFLPSFERGINPRGANSLKEMATRKAVSDQRGLTPAHFEHVPWRIAEHLWNFLCQRHKNTLYMWKIFAKAYPLDFREISRHYSLHVRNKRMPFFDYIALVRSDHLNWGTVFSVSTDNLTLHGLVDIGKITNLVALDITFAAEVPIDNDATVPITLTDGLLRSWSEMASAGEAFKHLRILVLRKRSGITERIFNYLDNFPSLVAFIISEFPGNLSEDIGLRHGWKMHHIDPGYRTVYEYIKDRVLIFERGTCQLPLPGLETLPLLEFSLGDMRPWSRNIARSILLLRENSTARNIPRVKKRESEDSANGRKRIRKAQANKDIADLLAEFQWWVVFSSCPEMQPKAYIPCR